ncbi:STAS domain-containing protein [Streptomyces sp. NPDC101178]|uniref:STAS domain-containing protein n=1 Tax=Streptomyces sp. NPDC101178 TaxID=3366124 RepID=UPI00382232D2
MPRSQPRVHIRQIRNALVITASGEFDIHERDLLHAAWAEADDRALPLTVLDLAAVSFGDSSFLDALLRGRRLHHTAGRRLVLTGPLQPGITMLLTLTGALDLFEQADTVAQALDGDPTTDGTATAR